MDRGEGQLLEQKGNCSYRLRPNGGKRSEYKGIPKDLLRTCQKKCPKKTSNVCEKKGGKVVGEGERNPRSVYKTKKHIRNFLTQRTRASQSETQEKENTVLKKGRKTRKRKSGTCLTVKNQKNQQKKLYKKRERR